MAFLLWPDSAARAAELTPVGGPAKPDFSLQDLHGDNVPLKTFKGRTVLVHFFAAWCEPCREELPALNRFLKRSASNASVVAVSVAEVDPRVKRFFERAPVDFPVLLDRDRAIAKSWKISALPTTYVLDANMKPMLVVETDFAWDTVELEPATGKLIKIKAAAIKTTSERPSNLKIGGNDHEL
ncbi:MAG TPA: TlpA disulfide reductase family protein [Bradyrhizobium sp.]|nr:TlpA disulfide reductase family protein [Bradyrhizobium sp.]